MKKEQLSYDEIIGATDIQGDGCVKHLNTQMRGSYHSYLILDHLSLCPEIRRRFVGHPDTYQVDWRVSYFKDAVLDDFWAWGIQDVVADLDYIDPDNLWAVISRKGKDMYVVPTLEECTSSEEEYMTYKTSTSKKKQKIGMAIVAYLEQKVLEVSFDCYVCNELDPMYDYKETNCSLIKLNKILQYIDYDMVGFCEDVLYAYSSKHKLEKKNFRLEFIRRYYETLRIYIKKYTQKVKEEGTSAEKLRSISKQADDISKQEKTQIKDVRELHSKLKKLLDLLEIQKKEKQDEKE